MNKNMADIISVRNSVAYSLAAIAHWDWPDHWPQLFDILMQVRSCNGIFILFWIYLIICI
jgi:hypothetical protein